MWLNDRKLMGSSGFINGLPKSYENVAQLIFAIGILLNKTFLFEYSQNSTDSCLSRIIRPSKCGKKFWINNLKEG
jgi:hypothetical protein